MTARISEEKESQVLELIEKEHYAAEIARLTDVCHATVVAVAKRNGVSISRPRKQTPEERRELRRIWHHKNRDKINKAKREMYAKNPDKDRESSRKWFEANRDKVNARRRKYYADNCEKEKENRRRQRAEDPKKYREITRKSRAKNRKKWNATSLRWYKKNRPDILARRRKRRKEVGAGTEKDMQKEIVRRCKAGEAGEFGERIYANGNGQTLTSKELGCRPGKADLAIEGDRFFYRLELKTPVGIISKEQQEEHVRLNNRPLYHHEFARSVDEAMTIICRWAGLDSDPEVLTMGTEDTTV